MDAEELKVVLDEIRDIHKGHIEKLGYERDEREQRRAEEMCAIRGPHEYTASDVNFRAGKHCKFCGKSERP